MSKSLKERIQEMERGAYKEPQITQVIQRGTNHDYKKLVKPIVSITLAASAGTVGLLFFIMPAIEQAKENPNISEPAKGILPFLAIVYIAVIVFGVVVYMAASGRKAEETEETEVGQEENVQGGML